MGKRGEQSGKGNRMSELIIDEKTKKEISESVEKLKMRIDRTPDKTAVAFRNILDKLNKESTDG